MLLLMMLLLLMLLLLLLLLLLMLLLLLLLPFSKPLSRPDGPVARGSIVTMPPARSRMRCTLRGRHRFARCGTSWTSGSAS